MAIPTFFAVIRFGHGFQCWVELLYWYPLAAVRVNGVLPRTFRIGRGTRQGGPPLLSLIRTYPGTLGLQNTM